MKFPPEFEKKVDMRKVNIAVIRPWIAKKIVELVGFEDEVVVEYAMGLLEDESQPTPDPKKMQINLTGFLTKDTPVFMTALWKLLLEAQDDVAGVPRTFVEEKKAEMRRNRENGTRAIDESDQDEEGGVGEAVEGSTMIGEEDRETAVGVLVAVLLVEDPKDVAHALPSPVVVLALLRAHARSICAIDTDPHHRILVLVVVRLPATRTGISAAPVLHLRLGVDRPSLVRPRGPRLLRLAGVRALRHTLLHLVTATEVRGATNVIATVLQPGEDDSHPVCDRRVPSPSADHARAHVLHLPVVGVVSATREGALSVRRVVDVGARQVGDPRHQLRRGGGVRLLSIGEGKDVDGVRVEAGREAVLVVRLPLVRGKLYEIEWMWIVGERRSKWEEEPRDDADHRAELEKRENELKEKALRNKVMKSRKGSN
ncbi:PWI domain-containing protein [Termitomyces sp. J132]|nr:PWI domain-containing protein [Termitomyces sp. J132]